jgi:hypothetical protein
VPPLKNRPRHLPRSLMAVIPVSELPVFGCSTRLSYLQPSDRPR